jgi:hypothetical protein
LRLKLMTGNVLQVLNTYKVCWLKVSWITNLNWFWTSMTGNLS